MLTHPITDSLDREHRLCEQALRGLDEWLASGSPVLRHPMTACCSAILRHIDSEESIVFPRMLQNNPALAPVISRLSEDHRRVRDMLEQIEDLINVVDRNRARAAISTLLETLAAHNRAEEVLIFPHISAALPDLDEVSRLFGGGHFRIARETA